MNRPRNQVRIDRSDRFRRSAEWLVLEGVRRWMSGDGRDDAGSETALHLFYRRSLPDDQARAATAAMVDFAEALGWCAACPLHGGGSDDGDPSRDEVLIVGLVAAIQNGDGRAAELCLRRLTCANRCDAVALAAGAFALIMRGFGKMLLPMPAALIGEILDQAAHRGRRSMATLH